MNVRTDRMRALAREARARAADARARSMSAACSRATVRSCLWHLAGALYDCAHVLALRYGGPPSWDHYADVPLGAPKRTQDADPRVS